MFFEKLLEKGEEHAETGARFSLTPLELCGVLMLLGLFKTEPVLYTQFAGASSKGE